ncbi:MAG: hypothetical protein WDO15_29125 [Bacteroidota bacterium]
MKSLYLIALAMAVIFAIAVGCSGAKRVLASSEWRAQTVTVDGNPDDWQQPLRYANIATGLSYSISNDDEKIYFCITTNERRGLAKMTMGGLQLQVEAAGTKPAYILYPIPGTVKPEKQSKKGQQENKKKEWQLSEEATSLQVAGFSFAPTVTELPLINKFGANVATNFGKDRFVYEASFPIADLNLKDKEFNVTIILKGIPKSQMESQFNGMNQGQRTGPGGMRMGGQGRNGGPGFPGGGSNRDYAQMFADQKINLTMRLATQ